MKRLLLLFVAILAFLSGYAQGGYNPENPADPNQYRRLTVTASPKAGGSVSPESRLVGVGETVTCTAYPHQYHEFAHWEKDGVVVAGNTVSSDDYYDDYYGSNTYTFVMPDKDVEVVAVFKANYNPGSPQDPGANVFVEATGEMIIDKFTPGNLSVAISSLVGYESGSQIQTLLVCGVMGEYDFYCLRDLPNCSKIDLSRTSGFSEIPYYAFSGASSLTDLLLPSCVSHINGNAFEGCGYLFELTCHALVPPTLADDAFAGVGSSLVVRVPEQSVDLYKNAKGWKAYTILPIQEDIVGITVSLPNGISAKDFRGMWLELTNTKSGQRLHYVMTDRRQYTFPNIISNTTWNIVLRNERGDVFGQIDNVEVGSEDVSVTFAALSKPQTVTLHVLTPEGTDVTTQTQVTWLDADGNYLAQSATMGGLCVGKKLVPRITLQKDLAITYTAPQQKEYTVVETSNNIVCRLEEITEVTLSGKVTDESTRSALSGVYVSASQTFAGKHSKTVGTKTDAKGNYSLTVLNVPTTLSVASSDYISQTFVCDMPMDGSSEVKLEDVALKPITGATISINFTYTPSVAEGEEASVQEWYSDYNNVTYTIYNKTKARAISQYSVQYPRIVLLEDVDEGDVLEVTASSVTSSFVTVKATATIDAEQHALAGFDIVALGGFKASFKKTANAAVVGSLYDGNGKLVKAYNYSNTVLTVSDLSDGHYTLVTMGSSTFFNDVYDLSQLPQTGLELGTDYVRHEFEVKSGVVAVVDIEEVPVFNESKFYYTGDNTSFTVNKTSIVAGNYLTLSARIDFKRAYATNVSNLNLIVDLPESCQFVENSVMVGNRLNHYSLDGNRLTIPVARYTDRIRFCVIPTLGGEYAPSALVDFMLDGEEKVQPIGNAKYSVKDLEINVPTVVAKNSISVSGMANADSEITIYDDDVVIGQTMSLANGVYSTVCELVTPYNLSKHNIYAKVVTKDSLQLRSETKTVQYDRSSVQITKVTMYHPNPEQCKTYVSVFDYQNPKTTPTNWVVYYPKKQFTYTVEFTDNSPEVVSNVVVYILTAGGEWLPYECFYDEDKDLWVANVDLGSACDDNYPVDVGVDFDANIPAIGDRQQITDGMSALYDLIAISAEEREKEIADFWREEDVAEEYLRLDAMLNAMLNDEEVDEEAFSTLMNSIIGDADPDSALSSDEAAAAFERWEKQLEEWEKTEGQDIINMIVEDLYADPSFDPHADLQFTVEGEDEVKVVSKRRLTEIDVDELVAQGFSKVDLNDGSALYYRYDEKSIIYVDVKEKTEYSVQLKDIDEATIKEKAPTPTIIPIGSNAGGYIECAKNAAFVIRNAYDRLTAGSSEDPVTLSQTICTALGDFLGSLNCYYTGFMETLRNNVEHAYQRADENLTRKFNEAEVQKALQQNRMAQLKRQWRVLESDIVSWHKELTNNKNLTPEQNSELQQKIKEGRASRKRIEEEIQSVNQRIKKAEKEARKFTKRMSKSKECSETFLKTFEQMPPNLTKGMKISNRLKWAGRMAGTLGFPIQVACIYLDGCEVWEEQLKWHAVHDEIVLKLPCEGDSVNAKNLKERIGNSMTGYLYLGCGVIVSEVAALWCATTGGVPFSPAWWTEMALSVGVEVTKTVSRNNADQARANYIEEIKSLKCKKELDEPEPTQPTPTPKPKPTPTPKPKPKNPNPGVGDQVEIDPSGFVYEGVFSNRLEGVTATCFYKETVEDMYGDLHDNVVKWNAEEYAQENPLFTDENGYYRWDVPQGLWQVKFEKEGYETTCSEWLPVPPPQLEVNIGMKQNVQPYVKAAHAYEDAVEVEFDKYMMSELLTVGNIIVQVNGKTVDGTVQLLNEEKGYEGKNDTYASKIRFNAAKPFPAREVSLRVSNHVKSYAGVRMQEDYMQTFTVEKELTKIVCDSVMTVPYGETVTIPIAVMPAAASAGKTLRVRTSSSMILSVEASELRIDEKGMAYITVVGELPGTSALAFSVADDKLTGTTIVNVVKTDANIVAPPRASIISGSEVEKGTEVYLFCSTEGATIYYTTDGSCPCDAATAMVYDGTPIVIDRDMTLKVMAQAPGLEESDVVTYTYTVKRNFDEAVTLEMPLEAGWNWVSLNLTPTVGNGIAAVLGTDWATGDYVKSNGEMKFNEYVAGKGWKNTGDAALQTLGSEYMYHVKAADGKRLAVTGVAVDEVVAPVAVHHGWNWIPYLPQVAMELNAALVGYAAQEGDVIKGINAYATFSAGLWTGSLSELQPGHGYMLYSQTPQTVSFRYGVAQGRRTASALARVGDKVISSSNNRYANNMTVVAKVVNVENLANTHLVASVNGEIRGTVTNLQHPVTGDNLYMLTISGDSESAIDLTLYGGDGEIGTATRALTYHNDARLGTLDNPLLIELQTKQGCVFPSPFSDVLYVQYVPRDADADVSILFANTCGQVVDNISHCNKSGQVRFTWRKAASVPQGVYMVSIYENGNVCKTYKVVKK